MRFDIHGYQMDSDTKGMGSDYYQIQRNAADRGFRLHHRNGVYWLSRPLNEARLFESETLDHCQQYVMARDPSWYSNKVQGQPASYPK